MDKATAVELLAIYQRAGMVLSEADPVLRALPEDEHSLHLRALAGMYAGLWETLQRPVVKAFPGLDPDIEIAVAGSADGASVAQLYAEAGYGAAVDPSDTVVVARLPGTVVGVVRLCPEQGVTVLRGMQIRAPYRRQGLGARLLAACLPQLEQEQEEAFCLPYRHLAGFYGGAGFETVGSAVLPAFLAARMAGYRAAGQDIIAMRRAGPL